MKYHRYPMLTGGLFAILFSVSVAFAQTPDTCPALVNTAVDQSGTNCANNERGFACYGFTEVTAFNSMTPNPNLSSEGDRIDLTEVDAVQTSPFDLSAGEWGLSIFNLQANVPNIFPGQGVVLFSLGGVEVESGVENPVTLVDEGVAVTTIAAAELLSNPDNGDFDDVELVGVIPSGTSLQADAVTADGYVRVSSATQFGWVEATSLDPSADLTGLPVLDADSFTAFQEFYYRVGIGGTSCNDAPSFLFVQGYEDNPVYLTIFDTVFKIEGAAVFESIAPGDNLGDGLEVNNLFGLVTISPGTGDEVIVPPGFMSTVGLCEEFASLGIEGDEDEKCTLSPRWSNPRPLTQSELDGFGIVSDIPDNLLNFPVDIPTIVQASGIGGPIARLVFTDPAALRAAAEACADGELPENVCEYLGL
jgi:hypothetical protein